MYRVAVLAGLLASTGCDLVFGQDQGPPAVRDFDGDGRFGDDDNCPFVPNAANFDDDDDGIGNECDPELAGADIVVEQTWFDETTATWSPTGAWTPTADGWRSPEAEAGGAIRSELRRLTRPVLQVGFTFVAFEDDLTSTQVELRLDGAGSESDCAVRRDPSTTSLSQLVMHTPLVDYRSARVMPEFEVDTSFVVTFVRAELSTCTTTGSRAMAPDEGETFDTAPTIVLDDVQILLRHATVYAVSDGG